MIELPILNYSFDEEAAGFGEPAKRPDEKRRVGEYVSIALIAIGAVFLVLALLGIGTPATLETSGDVARVWTMFAASFGLLVVGGLLYSVFRYKDTTPGIKNDGNTFRNIQRRGLLAWGLGVFITAFYIVLYWFSELRALGMPDVFATSTRLLDPLSHALRGVAADQWFVYGFLYTILVSVFGVRMILKYRHNRYQMIRTCSVMFFQLGFAFILPGLLKAANQPEFYFTYFWPLKPNYAWPGDTHYILYKGDVLNMVGVFMIAFGVFAILVLTPVLTYFFGKRWYCSWVCGCGGLAETFGDPWRQLSSKSNTAWKFERVIIHSVLLFVILTTVVLWLNAYIDDRILGSSAYWVKKVYAFMIINAFSGVVGVGFYPLMGSRVWCRFGCPMAAILGLIQRYFSRFRITTNGDQCMSCGNCSTYCEMGIDVRAYAQRGENIVRASCVGCGVCAAVCPRGVLKLENGPRTGRYEADAGGPLDQFLHDLTHAPRKHK
ncbi:MAG: 4Fe-4S binding protein [Phycisphaerales bacterium]|nr:4Fe-4S binding protein [Phycisphaerales bacterium]